MSSRMKMRICRAQPGAPQHVGDVRRYRSASGMSLQPMLGDYRGMSEPPPAAIGIAQEFAVDESEHLSLSGLRLGTTHKACEAIMSGYWPAGSSSSSTASHP